jgi:phospholipid transport system substrate-binding protein
MRRIILEPMIRRIFKTIRSVTFAAITITALLASNAAGPSMARAALPDSAADPMASVKSVIDQTFVVFKDKQIAAADREQKLRTIAETRFDFQEMARSAVGYHWRDFTPAQKSEFVPLFTAFIEDAYLSRIEQYSVEKVDQQIQSSLIQFNKETTDGPDYAEVFSTVVLKDRNNPIQVNYLMRRDGNQWKIYDIALDAISVIANYRNQFNRVLNNDGYDKLVSIMREKQQALGASLAK